MRRQCRKEFAFVPNFRRLYDSKSPSTKSLFDALLEAAILELGRIGSFDWGFFDKKNIATATLCLNKDHGGRHFCFFDIQEKHIRVRLVGPEGENGPKFNVTTASDVPNAVGTIREFLVTLYHVSGSNVPDVSDHLAGDGDAIEELSSAEELRLTLARRGQGKFRDNVLKYWKRRCAISNCSIREVLIAAHIKPWRDCNRFEKLDPNNGICMAASLEKAFDSYVFMISQQGAVIFSERIPVHERALLPVPPGLVIERLSAEHFSYLKYHEAQFHKANL